MARDLGKHDAQIAEHDRRMDAQDRRLESIERKVDKLLSAVDQAKGGWRILVAVYGAATVITAAIFKVWGIVKGGAG